MSNRSYMKRVVIKIRGGRRCLIRNFVWETAWETPHGALTCFRRLQSVCVLWVRTQEVRPPLQLFHIRRDLSLQLHTLIIFLATLLLLSPTFPKLIMKVSSFLLHPNDSLHVSLGCDKLTADWNMTIKPWGRQFCPLFIRNMHPPSFARMHIPPFNDTIFPFCLVILMSSPCRSLHPTHAAGSQSTLLCLALVS